MDEKLLDFIEKYQIVAEIIAAILILSGGVLKFYDVPVGNLMLIISFILLGAMYFMQARLYKLKKEYGVFERFFLVFALYGAAFIALGILFRSQFWPWGKVMVMTGLSSSGVALLVIAYYHFRKIYNLRKLLYRIGFWFAISLVTIQITPLQYVEFMFRNDPEYIRLFKQYIEEPDNEMYYEQWRYYNNLKKQ